MNGRTSAMAVVAVLTLALFAGVYATESPNSADDERSASVETCDSLPDYDYERMVERVEDIKGERLKRNLSICVERKGQGIDTTPSRSRFARIEEPGLSFFGLDADVNSKSRSSLGHMELSPSSGQIEIFLANESVVKSIPWISYEGLVTHEMSDAIEATVAVSMSSNVTANSQATAPQTTDAMLARQALSNGVSLYVSDLYVRRYGGHLNASALSATEKNWKRQVVQSVYYYGYRYAEQTDRRTVHETTTPNSTTQILHPNETRSVTGVPTRPNLSVDSLEHVRTDRIGELFVRAALRSKGVSPARAAAAADGWANDRMDYYRANGSTVVTWRVRWQNTGERAEFIGAYDEVYDYERVKTLDSVDCEKSGRYLTVSENAVTVLQCRA